MSRLTGSRIAPAMRGRRLATSRPSAAVAISLRFGFAVALLVCIASARANIFGYIAAATTPPAEASVPSTSSISREVKEIFEKSGKAVVKIRGTDEHGELSGTGFFIDPTGLIYTAYSVGGDTENLTIEFDGNT